VHGACILIHFVSGYNLQKLTYCYVMYRENNKNGMFVGDFGRRLEEFTLQNSGIINYVCLTYQNSA